MKVASHQQEAISHKEKERCCRLKYCHDRCCVGVEICKFTTNQTCVFVPIIIGFDWVASALGCGPEWERIFWKSGKEYSGRVLSKLVGSCRQGLHFSSCQFPSFAHNFCPAHFSLHTARESPAFDVICFVSSDIISLIVIIIICLFISKVICFKYLF